MKVILDRELFARKLKSCYGFIPNHQIIPAWENFMIRVNGSDLEIIASNGSIQGKMWCPCKSTGPFVFCAPATLLLKTVSLFSEMEITITMKKEDKIELKSGKGKYNITLDCFESGYSLMPMGPITSEINLNQFMLKSAFKSAQKFVDAEHPNANMQAINISEIGNKIVFTGLDKQLMCRVAIRPISINAWGPINIPLDLAKNIVALLGDKGEIGVAHSVDKIRFFTDAADPDRFEVTSVTSNIKFPPSEKLFSKMPAAMIAVNTIEFKNAVKRLSLYTTIGMEPMIHISNDANSQELVLASADNLTGKDGEEIISIINPESQKITKKYHGPSVVQLLGEIEAAETIIYFNNEDYHVPSFMIPKVNNDEENIYSFLIASLA